jgi:hypothetical protein
LALMISIFLKVSIGVSVVDKFCADNSFPIRKQNTMSV